jgi:hypothetical protein
LGRRVAVSLCSSESRYSLLGLAVCCSASSSSSSSEAFDPSVCAKRFSLSTLGWFLTRSGRNEFSSTKLAPKQVFAIIARSAPIKNTLGTTGRNSIVAIEPIKAKLSKNVLRNLPWSAAPDMEMMRIDWMSTLMEKVYIAKLAVLTSMPPIKTTHCEVSAWDTTGAVPKGCTGPPAPLVSLRKGGTCEAHGVLPSVCRTPRSLANCSRVIGMKDPS